MVMDWICCTDGLPFEHKQKKPKEQISSTVTFKFFLFVFFFFLEIQETWPASSADLADSFSSPSPQIGPKCFELEHCRNVGGRTLKLKFWLSLVLSNGVLQSKISSYRSLYIVRHTSHANSKSKG